MTFRQFHSLLRHFTHTIKHNTLYHHPHHFLYTSSRFNLQSTSNRRHIFITPYPTPILLYLRPHLIHHIKRYNTPLFNLSHHKSTPYHHHPFLISKRSASMDVTKDYYKILNVNKNATKKEIRSSYLRLAKQWHPDLHKEEKAKQTARNKFIEVQESYEVLHNNGMRKKYDEMRRYGFSQDQYKAHEAYSKQPPSGFTKRQPNAWETEWEQQFRRSMHSEWEKIKRDQQDWANARRAERHKYADQFPFGDSNARGGFGAPNPFGGGFGGNEWNNLHNQQQMYNANPMEGFFRTMVLLFGFFLALRLCGYVLFGPPMDRGRHGPSGYDPFNGPSGYRKDKRERESPFYSQSSYNRYNHNLPPPLSLREKKYDEYKNEERKNGTLKRNKYEPYSPPPPVSNRNSLRDNNKRRESTLDEEDGNQYTFTKPGPRQTTDVSSPAEQRRKARKGRTKYEKMLEEQRMMEDVYIKARRKQMEETEFKRQRQMNKRFGRHGDRSSVPPENSTQNNDEDPNEAWERYLNSKSNNDVSWRDRGRR